MYALSDIYRLPPTVARALLRAGSRSRSARHRPLANDFRPPNHVYVREPVRTLRKTVFSSAWVVLGTALWAGCSSGGDDGTDGNDQAATAGCKVINEQTGKPMTADELSKQGDPIAQR